MNILVSGSSGLIGTALVPFLTTGGHRVIRLVRSKPAATVDEVSWDPTQEKLEAVALQDIEAIVHLAGENLAAGRWTTTRKARIRDSRVRGTRFLCETVAKLPAPPRVLICASAIGYYGDRGDEILEEDSASGAGFLPEVCRAWESATEPARNAGVRVVNLRLGIVLAAAGGALKKMLLPFQLGAGGVVGSGRQYWSWIALDDVAGAIHHAIMNETLSGPVNAVAPQAVTNYEFTKTLGRILSRPTIFAVPALALRLAFGEMAEEMLLASTRVQPTKLMASNYPYRFTTLESALRHVLGKE